MGLITSRYKRLVELNVLEQATRKGYPIVNGWVFDMHSGILIDLNINFVQILKNIQKIYDLTSLPAADGWDED